MKKFAIKSFVFGVYFSVFFLLINIFYLGIIVPTSFEFIKRIEALKFDNPDFELLVLGASTSWDGIDTELLTSIGIKSYNLALGGTTVRSNVIQLNEYLDKYSKRPQYVLLGINSQLVKTFDDGVIHPIVEVTMEGHHFGINDAPILKFKWLGFELLKKIVSKKLRKAKLSYGQLKYQKINPDNTSYGELFLNVEEFESSYWIGELAKLCTQNGIKLIIMEMPGYRVTQNLSETGPYILNFKNGYSANLYNFNSRNFCKIFDAERDWIGNSHLNEFGAVKFTKELIKLL